MNILDHILLVGVGQGLFLSLALLVRNFGKQKQNYFFLLLMVLISLTLATNYLFTVERYRAAPHIWYFFDLVAYLIGPLWYFTIQKSIRTKVRLQWSEALLLAPISIYLIYFFYLLSFSPSELLTLEQRGTFNWFFYVFCVTVLIVNGGFLIKAHLTLQNYRDTRFPDLLIKGQYAFLIIIGIWMLAFGVSFLLANQMMVNLAVYRFAFLSLAFLVFGMAFLALVKPESFYFLTQTFDHSEAYVLQQIADRAQQFIEEEKPYLKGSFTLAELSAAIQSNPVLTSKAINRVLGATYSDLMNGYRVKHFLQLARDTEQQHLTHWAIAQEAGFGNKASFYKSFKKMMGTTPKVYLSQHASD